MAEQARPLTDFYSGWAGYQKNLAKIIAPLTPEQLALPTSSHHWTVGMVAQHIIGNRVWWFQVWMGEGSPALAPIAHWDPADEMYHHGGELSLALGTHGLTTIYD